ncbi:MAG: hypothetical protein AB1449_11805 [Chloroflexota bacterium]
MAPDLELLSRAALALSLFITFMLLWLGMTTLLAARRGDAFGRAAGLALLLAAAFFLSHGMIVGKGPTASGSGMEFWWRLGWLPAISAPLTWYATVIRYAGLPARHLHMHRRAWLAFVAVGIVILVLLVIDNPFSTYRSLLIGVSPALRSRPLIWLYLSLTVAGFAFPVVALIAGRGEQVAHIRAQARPWLIGTGLCLLGASGIVAVTATWAVGNALPLLRQEPQTVNNLLAADVAAQVLVAGATVLLGRAVVAYEVFTERPLPRQGFFRRWRSVVLASAAAAGYVTLLLVAEIRPLYGLASLALLGMTAYALFTWQSYNAHERFLARLLPFVTSLELSDRLLRPDAPDEFAQQASELLRALCEDALGAQNAELVVEGDPPRHLHYGPSPADETGDALRLQLTSAAGHATAGTLVLGGRRDGRPYASEEIELARACGQRLLDAVAGERIAHLLLALLRRRLGELQVVGTRHKRILHDDVLPDIHLALLRLDDPATAAAALGRAHRQLSELLQAGPKSAADHLDTHGLLSTLRETVERDFASEFAHIEWEVEPEVEAQDLRPGLVGEVVYYAALEAVRNAARHASGGTRRKVQLFITARWRDGLELEIRDNGVGLRPTATSLTGHQGLLFHSTMMAVIGGRLSMVPSPDGVGISVRLWVPLHALRLATEPSTP